MDLQRPGADARGGDPGALLAAMLEREEAEEGQARDIIPGRIDAEDAAFLVEIVALVGRDRIGGLA